MAAKLSNDEEILAEINVTPLVDIMLVLLIIFMVTASYIVAPSIEVELPEAASGEPTEVSTLGITIEADGTLYLNGERISEEGLRAAIPTAKAQSDEVQAIIAADKNVIHGTVMHVIDIVKQGGVHKFAINIEPGS